MKNCDRRKGGNQVREERGRESKVETEKEGWRERERKDRKMERKRGAAGRKEI